MCRKSEKLKISYSVEETFFFSIICSKGKNKYGKIIKEKESIEIL